MDPPYTVEKYATDHPTCFDVERFRPMPQSTHFAVRDVYNVNRLTAKGSWTKRWNHWGGRGVLSASLPREDLNMRFIRMSEESVYVRKVGELIDSIADAPRDEPVHRDFCVYWFPHGELWFIVNDAFWWRDIDFE